MPSFSNPRPLASGPTDSTRVLADNGIADGDLTLLQLAQHAASKGLAPGAGTPLAVSIVAKADAVKASPVVPAGVTVLTRTAVTTAGAEAPTGHFNRPLQSDHSVSVDSTGATAPDGISVMNIGASAITLTAGSVSVNIAPGKVGELSWKSTAFVDVSPVDLSGLSLTGVTYDASATPRITGYSLGGTAYTVAYPSATSIVVQGGGRTTTITLNASGQVVGKVVA